MNRLISYLGLLIFTISNLVISAQGVAINESATTPDPNAILDISSSTKGLLIPRMTTTERNVLGNSTPTEGLLVYDADSSSFFYYDGGWVRIAGGSISTHSNSVIINQPLHLEGNAVVYREFRVPASSAKASGVGVPLYGQVTNLGNIYQHFFQDVNQAQNEQSLYFNIQMPYTWKEGSPIYPHVHWMPSTTGSGNVRWGFEYTWVNVDGTYSPTSVIYGNANINNERYKHLESDINSAPMNATGKKSGSMLLCRIFRNSSNTADTYTGDAILLEFDIIYQIDKLGSQTIP